MWSLSLFHLTWPLSGFQLFPKLKSFLSSSPWTQICHHWSSLGESIPYTLARLTSHCSLNHISSLRILRGPIPHFPAQICPLSTLRSPSTFLDPQNSTFLFLPRPVWGSASVFWGSTASDTFPLLCLARFSHLHISFPLLDAEFLQGRDCFCSCFFTYSAWPSASICGAQCGQAQNAVPMTGAQT